MKPSLWIYTAVGLAAIAVLWPQSVHGKGSTNAFPIGRILSAEEMAKVSQMTTQDMTRMTIGRVHEKAVRKYGGDFEKYIEARGGMKSKSIGGKAFEAFTVKDFQRLRLNDYDLVPSTVLNKPGDAADLILIHKQSGTVSGQYQLKSGYKSAMNAVTDVKYDGITIVTHPEELEKIRQEINNRKLAGKKLSPKLAAAEKAIESGRLTDKIALGEEVLMEVPTRKDCISKGVRYVKMRFHEAKALLAKSMENPAGKAIAKAAEIISESKLTKPVIIVVTRSTKGVVIVAKPVVKIAGKLLGPADIAFSAWQMQHTISQRHLYDDDLFAGRIAAQGGLMTVGVYMLLAPEPTWTKVAGVIIVSVALAGGDMALEQAHERRLDSRKQLMKKLDARDRHEAAADLIRAMIARPGAQLY